MARSVSLMILQPNKVKAPGSMDRSHRTPFSDNLRVMTNGEFQALSLIDIDAVIGADDGKRVVLSAVFELKETILDLKGNVTTEHPHHEAVTLFLAWIAKARFFKVLDGTPTSASQIVAVESDTATGRHGRRYTASEAWRQDLQAAAVARLPTGKPFELSGKTRLYVLYACDNRWDNDFTYLVRNYGVIAFIVETVGAPVTDGTTNRDLRICRVFADALAHLQNRRPIVALAQAATDVGPWRLELRNAQNRTVQAYELPELPPDPAFFLTDPRVVLWQQQWYAALRLIREYDACRNHAVHRSLREDGKLFCLACLAGPCMKHKLGVNCGTCRVWTEPMIRKNVAYCRSCGNELTIRPSSALPAMSRLE